MTTRMNLEDFMLSEISQTEKDKYCVILLFMWNKKKHPKTHRYREQIEGQQRVEGVGERKG